MRCHHNDVKITELAESSTTWTFLAGELYDDADSEPFPTGDVEVKCDACGLKRTYRKWPKWLQHRMDQVANRERLQ